MHHVLRVCRGLISLGLMAALGVACSSATAPAPTGEQPAAGGQGAAQVPKRGGEITINATSRWHADPAMGQTPYQTWYYVGDPMIRRHVETFALQPVVFESWQVSQDGKEIVLKVRQGMKLHNKPPFNGREVEAKDLVYTLKSATGQQYPDLSPVRFPRKESFGAMTDAVAVDKYTVKVTLSAPSVSFLHALADYRGAWVYPDGLREAFGGVDALAVATPERHIGSGPFILTKVVADSELVHERNPDYWDKDQHGTQLPYADRVRIIFLKDVATQQAAFAAGQLHVFSTATEQNRNFVVKNVPNAKIVTYKPESCWRRISLNTTRKPFDDYRVRRALYLVMDKKQVGDVVSGDWEGKPLWVLPGPIPFVFPEARPQEELAKHPLYQGPTPENVAAAKRLLDEAGYSAGFEFDLHLSKTDIDQGQVIERQWGNHLPQVKVTLKSVDAETHRALATKGEYDAQLYCHIFDVTAVSHIANAYHSAGGRNYARYQDPQLDAILDEADRTLEADKYKQLMRQAEDRILDHSLSMLPTSQYYGQYAVQPALEGIAFGPGSSYLMSVRNWWWNK